MISFDAKCLFFAFLACVGAASCKDTTNNEERENLKPVGALINLSQEPRIQGLAYDPNTPDKPVFISIYIDGPEGSVNGRFMESVKTTLLNAGANESWHVTGNHAFVYQIPSKYMDGKKHKIYVYAIDTQMGSSVELNNSPFEITLSPKGH